MSSATITSARDPVSWEVIPRDFTEGACAAGAGPTSKASLEQRWSGPGRRCWNRGISLMTRSVKVLKSSARTFDAETTKIFRVGSR